MTQKLLFWTPRILGAVAIGFISLFALDAFNGTAPFGEKLLDFAMHLIPSGILALLLWFAWKKELWGGLLFMAIALAVTPFIWQHNYAMNGSWQTTLGVVLLIPFPVFVVGALFVWNHFYHKHHDVTKLT